jgi:hypothetical protein
MQRQSVVTATMTMKMLPLKSSRLRTRLRQIYRLEVTMTATAATTARMHSRRWQSQHPWLHQGSSRRPNPHRPLPFHERTGLARGFRATRTTGAMLPEWHYQRLHSHSAGYLKCAAIEKSVAATAETGAADTAHWVVATAVGFGQNASAGPYSPCRRHASTLLVQTETAVATVMMRMR